MGRIGLDRAALLRDRAAAVVPPSSRHVAVWVRWGAAAFTVLAVAVGIWVTGGLLTDAADLAMVLTAAWLAVAGIAAVLVALRWRSLAVVVLPAYALTTLVLGGYLLATSSVDRVVDEQVTVATDRPARGEEPGAAADAPTAGMTPGAVPLADTPVAEAPVEDATTTLASGEFRSGAHETIGVADVLQRPDGGRVLTLTGFETDPGPDLRVYLVPGDGSDVGNATDLGGLKGNKGDQEYDVPVQAPTGSVVIWCRAFSVEFGTATLG